MMSRRTEPRCPCAARAPRARAYAAVLACSASMVLSAPSFALAADPVAAPAGADRGAPRAHEDRSQTPWTCALRVDDDGDGVVPEDLLLERLARELGTPVVAASSREASSASVTIHVRYRAEVLEVRAVRRGGETVTREVPARGDVEEIRREAVLLAGNLARDEARELADALADAKRIAEKSGPPRKDVAPTIPPPPPLAPPGASARGGAVVMTAALAYPVATNAGRPDVSTPVAFSLLYDRIGASSGAQIGPGVSYAGRRVDGFQMGSVAITREVEGHQLGFGAAVAGGTMRGLQMGGAFAWAGDRAKGFQLAGAANITLGAVSGAQLSGGANVARELYGAQVSSVNVGEEVHGVQLGLVNVARRVKGAQIGLVNIAEEVDGATVALLGITKEGVHPVLSSSTASFANVGLRFETRYVYTVAAVGLGSPEDSARWGASVGIGARIPIGARVEIDVENVFSHHDMPSGQNLAVHYRVLGSYAFAKRLRLYGGGGFRSPIAFDVGSEAVTPELAGGVVF